MAGRQKYRRPTIHHVHVRYRPGNAGEDFYTGRMRRQIQGVIYCGITVLGFFRRCRENALSHCLRSLNLKIFSDFLTLHFKCVWYLCRIHTELSP